MKFVKCTACGRIGIIVQDSENQPKCCSEDLVELVAGSTDGAFEKHVPVIEKDGSVVTVSVGSVEHPMMDAHYIQWIVIETDKGFQQKFLSPKDKPVAQFVLAEGENLLAAYEYCNLHGLWKAEV